MPQEGESAPAEGQEPDAPKEGQEPQGEPKDEPTTFGQLPAETQREIKALRAEAAKYRKQAQEFEDAQKSELDKANTKAERAEQAKAEAEARLLRFEVAHVKEVPAKLVPLLTASSKEDLEAQADLILENAKPASPDFDGGARDPAPEPKSPEDQHQEAVLKVLGIAPN